MLIDRSGIARLIPHSGDMVLLDGVLHWDAAGIDCVAESHRQPANPLRRGAILGILCGIEYAAQAMALHGALGGGESQPRGGFLASLRDLACHTDRLDMLPGTLAVSAKRLHGEAGRVIYAFALRHDGQMLLEGRAAVVLAATVAA